MSRRSLRHARTRRFGPAPVFAALGDQTRLALLAKLRDGYPASISELTRGSGITRQAVTKHLRVLKSAGFVRSLRAGRENLFAFDPRPMKKIKEYLETVSKQWDNVLARLKTFVEKEKPQTKPPAA